MRKLCSIVLLMIGAALLTVIVPAFAQNSTASWPYFVELDVGAGQPAVYDLVVPFEVMDKASRDLSDLRIYDQLGREIPYALRVRRDASGMRTINVRMFNQGTVGSSTNEVVLDLGENAGEHNAVEIESSGDNFRRRVEIEGSDARDWRRLNTGDVIFSFTGSNGLVGSKRINYPTSRYRYLRVRVSADELSDDEIPEINDVRVLMAVREKGELVTWGVNVPPPQLLRHQGAPASSWTIDLGARVPCDRLALNFIDQSFSRPFYLEAIDGQDVRLVTSGELTRRAADGEKPLVINFNEEAYTRTLKLVVTDHSNPTLALISIEPSAPARQLVFELREPAVQPLRLFFGNSKIAPPHYDFEKELSGKLSKGATRIKVEAAKPNPEYKPEPLPFTERVPWLIYLVLAVSSIALGWILFSLARTTLRRGRAGTEQKPTG
jgi:Protein of unknown function (DUF3999)